MVCVQNGNAHIRLPSGWLCSCLGQLPLQSRQIRVLHKKFENLDALLNVPLGINESLQQFVNERDAEKARQMNGKEERVGDW